MVRQLRSLLAMAQEFVALGGDAFAHATEHEHQQTWQRQLTLSGPVIWRVDVAGLLTKWEDCK